MKTNPKSNKKIIQKAPKAPTSIDTEKAIKDEDLIVIKDASNGKEFFLSVIDTFVISKTEYIVMYNYEPDDGNHRKPELVIMRTGFAEKGDQYFYSIKDPAELELAFTHFMRRFDADMTSNTKAMKKPFVAKSL